MSDKVFETASLFVSSANNILDEEGCMYVQVKILTMTVNFRIINVLQIIDISGKILYHTSALH